MTGIGWYGPYSDDCVPCCGSSEWPPPEWPVVRENVDWCLLCWDPFPSFSVYLPSDSCSWNTGTYAIAESPTAGGTTACYIYDMNVDGVPGKNITLKIYVTDGASLTGIMRVQFGAGTIYEDTVLSRETADVPFDCNVSDLSLPLIYTSCPTGAPPYVIVNPTL